MNNKEERQGQIKAAGLSGAKANRAKAEVRYYENPPMCSYCNNQIILKPNQRVCDVLIKKFCSHSCAAKFNNQNKKKAEFTQCHTCGCNIINNRRKYCDDCFSEYRKSQRSFDGKQPEYVTKGEIIAKYGKDIGATHIRKHARAIVKNIEGKSFCCYCNYNIHVEVHHIKPIRSFEDYSTLSEINDISNLLILCRNHHWELEHGFLKAEDFGLIESEIFEKPKNILCLKEKQCQLCDQMYIVTNKKRKYCSFKCGRKAVRKCERPSKEELTEILNKNTYRQASRIYGVSDNAVRKWSEEYQIDHSQTKTGSKST